MRNNLIAVLPLLSLMQCLTPAWAHDPKTHVWVAQQILNDVVPDGKVTINGKEYPVSPAIHQALTLHPNLYRMGHVGPDAHPDLIVGQSYLHPGTGGGGWWADDWAKHIHDESKASGARENLAYSMGYWGHLAGDVIAHSYVNTYAGDYFLLSDEQEVELRHFVLEHYIGDRTPPLVDHNGIAISDYSKLLTPPSRFVSSTLILNDRAADQFLKVPGFSAHLLSAWRLHKSVHDLRVSLEERREPFSKEIDRITKLVQGLDDDLVKALDKIAELTPTLQPLIDQVELLKKAVDAQRELNRPIEEAASQLEKAFLQASDELANLESQLRNRVNDLANRVAREIAKVEGEINRFNDEIAHWADEASKARSQVDRLRDLLGPLQREYDRLEARLSRWVKHVPGLREAAEKLEQAKKELGTAEENVRNAVDNGLNIEAKLREKATSLTSWQKEKESIEKVISGLRSGITTANANVQRAKEKVMELSEPVRHARDKLAEKLNPWEAAQKKLDELKALLSKLEQTRDDTVRTIKDFNSQLQRIVHLNDELFLDPSKALVLVVKNWEEDLEDAMDAYVIAATEVLLNTMTPGSDHLRPMKEWFECWAPVFTGIPSEVPNATCKGKAYLRDFAERMKTLAEDFAARIPVVKELLEQIESVEERIKSAAIAAAIEFSDHIFGEAFTKFSKILNQHFTDKDLDDTYANDSSGKQLVKFNNMSTVIREELGMTGAWNKPYFDDSKFMMAIHSVTMAKLTLLGPDAFAIMATNYGITDKSIYATASTPDAKKHLIYPDESTFVNVLYRAVRSIDGNQQWRGRSLPYIRRNEYRERRKFGYCFGEDGDNAGFRIWADPNYRTNVFPKIFPGELKLATLTPGIAKLVPDYVEMMENEIECGVASTSELPGTPIAPTVREPAARAELEKERAVQIVTVPSVRLIDRIDGRSRDQVIAAIREETRIELTDEVRREVFAELRKSQDWEGNYREKLAAARSCGKCLLLVVEGTTPNSKCAYVDIVKDELQASLLEPFVLFRVSAAEPTAATPISQAACRELPLVLLVHPQNEQILCIRNGQMTFRQWAETLLQFDLGRSPKKAIPKPDPSAAQRMGNQK